MILRKKARKFFPFPAFLCVFVMKILLNNFVSSFVSPNDRSSARVFRRRGHNRRGVLSFPFPRKVEIDGYGRIVLYLEAFPAIVANFEGVEIAHFAFAAMYARSVVQYATFLLVSRIDRVVDLIVFHG